MDNNFSQSDPDEDSEEGGDRRVESASKMPTHSTRTVEHVPPIAAWNMAWIIQMRLLTDPRRLDPCIIKHKDPRMMLHSPN